MKAIIAAALMLGSMSAAADPQEGRAAGYWQGKLEFGAATMRVVFAITPVGSDSLTGTLDLPDQGAFDVPLTSVALSGDTLRIQVATVYGVYEGTLGSGDSVVNGIWRQGAIVLPLTLRRTELIPQRRRPQEPAKPYPYNEEQVTIQNAMAGVTLAGTLTTRGSGGPFPAAVLITGSGPQDRNETVFGHRPFLVLADHLARHGIAALRMDDRGVGGSTGSTTGATMEDFAGDILAGVEYLMTRSDIDHERIGLIGHSEGGTVAPIVTQRTNDVAFLVLMAGTGLPGERVLYLQDSLIARTAGMPDEIIARNRERMQEIYAMIRVETDSAALAGKLNSYLRNVAWSMSGDERTDAADTEKAIEAQVRLLTTPWFRHFLVYDPRPALRSTKCPVLAINGEKDLQVSARENLREIERTLREGGNTNVTVMEFPDLNHLFQHARTGAVTEYASIEETIAPAVLDAITEWIRRVVEE